MDSSYINFKSFNDCNAVMYANKKLIRYFQGKFDLVINGIFELESVTQELIIRKSKPNQYVFECYAYDKFLPILVYETEEPLDQILKQEEDYWVFMKEEMNKTTFVMIKAINVKASCKDVKKNR